jgi:hypothetical protein
LITLGVDAHKAIHVAFAVDGAGRELGEWQGPITANGWTSLARWAADFGPDCWWGIEGAWGNGRGLAQHLVALGFTVLRSVRIGLLASAAGTGGGVSPTVSMSAPWRVAHAKRHPSCRWSMPRTTA